jgi:hypothetical protein
MAPLVGRARTPVCVHAEGKRRQEGERREECAAAKAGAPLLPCFARRPLPLAAAWPAVLWGAFSASKTGASIEARSKSKVGVFGFFFNF